MFAAATESLQPDVSEPQQISPSHNNAAPTATAATKAPESVLDVCPEPNCPHCLAYKELIVKAGGSDAVTSLASAFPDGSVGSPQSHMDVQSHGTPLSSMGVPSPPSSGGNPTPDVTNPQIFEMTGGDNLQELFATWSPTSGGGSVVDPETSPTPKHSPPPLKSKWKSKDNLLQNTLRKTNSQSHVSTRGGGGGNESPMQLVKALARSPSPPPAYKLNDSVPPPIDKEPKAFGSNVIHLGNGMALTEREVVDMPVHELNRLLYQSKLTEAEISLIKETRRRGKNKVAARNCRKRKMDTISELEKEVDELKAKKDKVAEERDLLAKELEIYKSKTESLTRFILEKVKYGSGLKLNIDQLALDKAEDGRLFVMPNLSASGDEDGHLAVIA